MVRKNIVGKLSCALLVLFLLVSFSMPAFASEGVEATPKVNAEERMNITLDNGQNIELKEGEVAQIPLVPVSIKNDGSIQPLTVVCQH